MAKAANAIWGLPKAQPDIDGDALSRWMNTTKEVRELATANGWGKTEAGRRAGIPDGTFSQWYSGNYAGDIDGYTTRVRQWLTQVRDAAEIGRGIPAEPGFVQTKTAMQVIRALRYAQSAPEMVTIVLAPGMGKTFTCDHYTAVTPHVYNVTMRPQLRSVHALMQELCRIMDIPPLNSAKMDVAIAEKVKRNGRMPLIIVDEAQQLSDAQVNQLRWFLDKAKCGLALVGNSSVQTRFASRAKDSDDADWQLEAPGRPAGQPAPAVPRRCRTTHGRVERARTCHA